GFQPPQKARIIVAGPKGYDELMSRMNEEHAAGQLSDTDVRLAAALLGILTGGPGGDPLKPAAEEDLMALERECLLDLVQTAETSARIEHMLKTGKPLKN